MSSNGSFEITLIPQLEDEEPVGRMTINKLYQGDMEGTGLGQMISKRTEDGTAIYFAIEEFSGSIDKKSGAFTLVHKGSMDTKSQSLEIFILEGSGTDQLKSISGSMNIIKDSDVHTYELNYEL